MTEPSAFSGQQEKITLWTRGCIVALMVSFLLLGGLVCGLYHASAQPKLQAPPERINPNTAPVGSLVRLSGIGRARALDIIHYRQQHPGKAVFMSAGDLEKIRGIGPKTVEKISPYLAFESKLETR